MFGMLLIKQTLGETFSEKSGKMLRRFTKGRLSALASGTLITALLQSSSAVSVLTAAFADRGIISLYKALWVIVGANLGTTFTGMLTGLPFSDAASFSCVVGVCLISLSKKKNAVSAGYFLTGFGLLFVGMDMMEAAAGELRHSAVLYDILRGSSAPLTGLLTGCFFTALIQSSSAVTALLQTMAEDGIIGMNQAFYIILGANIGTCATCFIASRTLGGAARRVAVMHVLYNLCGSLIFVVIAEIFPLTEIALRLFPGEIKLQTGFLNVFFNGTCALLMLLLPIKEGNFLTGENKKQHLHLRYNMVK